MKQKTTSLIRRSIEFFLITVASLLTIPAIAEAYAPVDRPGPALSVPQADLDNALTCSSNLRNATKTPVLLSPGTSVNPQDQYSWNWVPALNSEGIPWCMVTMPDLTYGDIQIAGEYLVNAIRSMYQRAGRKISIVGHSQGGMSMRWALRFWPDTRNMVDDVIGLAGTNHGTTSPVVDIACLVECPPAMWQQDEDSNFIKALNSGTETFAGISYTNVYTRLDEVSQPALNDNGTSSLHLGAGLKTNVANQDICPLNPALHIILGTIDPVAYALALDALKNPGPANPSRVSRSVCFKVFMPGVNLLSGQVNLQGFINMASAAISGLTPINIDGVGKTSSEPPLASYVY